MSNDRFAAEQEAFRGMVELFSLAERIKLAHERAGLTPPEPLRRLLGMNENGAKQANSITIQPPPVKSSPPGMADDWISIPFKAATPMTVVPAVLRGKKLAMRAKDVVAKALEINPSVSGGSVANTLSRLTGLIERADDGGWLLSSGAAAAVIHDGRLWGPASVFQKTEVAYHRREAILWILNQFASGLQTLQIVEHLGSCKWLHAPVNKDLVKEDFNFLLKEGKVRRRGNTKKWEIAPDREED